MKILNSLPEKAKEIYKMAYGLAIEKNYKEDDANELALDTVKDKYIKVNHKWILKGDKDMEKVDLFLKFTKFDEEKRMVYGIATSEALDKTDEIVDFEATKNALVEFKKWRNLREMHQPSAVGTIPDIEIDEVKKIVSIGAKVIDDNAWIKCKEKVYKGFSIGGKNPKRMVQKFADKKISRITEYDMTEISLVDRPCNPDSVFTMLKIENTDEYKEVKDNQKHEIVNEPITIGVDVTKSFKDFVEKIGSRNNNTDEQLLAVVVSIMQHLLDASKPLPFKIVPIELPKEEKKINVDFVKIEKVSTDINTTMQKLENKFSKIETFKEEFKKIDGLIKDSKNTIEKVETLNKAIDVKIEKIEKLKSDLDESKKSADNSKSSLESLLKSASPRKGVVVSRGQSVNNSFTKLNGDLTVEDPREMDLDDLQKRYNEVSSAAINGEFQKLPKPEQDQLQKFLLTAQDILRNNKE